MNQTLKNTIIVVVLFAAVLVLFCMSKGYSVNHTFGITATSTTAAIAPASLFASTTVSTSTNAFSNTEWLLSDGTTMNLIIALTSAEQELGLGDRASLPTTEGMFFVFAIPYDYGFWMKDMQFPLDIIWLNQDFKIIHIEQNLATSTYPQIFYPGSPAKYVVEVNAGFVARHSLIVGQTMQIGQK